MSDKTNRQRQAEYRARRAEAGGNGERRLNTWLPTGTMLALSRLARRHGVTQRETLARLIAEADKAILDKLEPDSREWQEYFGGRSRRRIRA